VSGSYVWLKWLHVLAACSYVGGSLANGLLKALADRAQSAEASAALLRAAVWNDWLLLAVPSVVLPATGIAMARLAGLSLVSGWVAQGIVLFVLLSVALVCGMRLEHRLERLAREAASRGEPLPQAYRALALPYAGLGLVATLAILATLFVMVAKRTLV